MSEAITNIVDVATLAAFFGVDERTIQYWVSNNGAPRLELGKYDFLQFVQWRLNYLGNEIKKLEAGGDKKYELETEKLQISNKRDWIKFQKEIHSLVPVEMVRQAYVSDAVAYKSALVALENKLYLVLNADAEHRKLIKKEIDEVRSQIGTELRISDDDELEELIAEDETEITEEQNND